MKTLIRAAVVLAALAVSATQADTFYVDDDSCPGPGDGSELGPYCSIQTAIDNAVDTDEVVVAPGTYFETIDFLGKAITLRSSDGPEVTVIDALQAGRVVTCTSGEGPDTVLSGFMITGGNAGVGAGMLNNRSSPTVTNCTFTRNTANTIAGAMYNSSGSTTVTNCTFIGNTADVAGGGLYNVGGSPTVTNCNFTGNMANNAGGIFNSGGSPTVINCMFTGNSAILGGGIRNLGGNPTVTNCTFTGNTAIFGGGMDNSGSSPTVTNCTFTLNSAPNGQALAFDSFQQQSPSNLVMTNSILWNGGLEIWNNDGSTIAIAYTNVQGGFPGIGNIDADPLFVDPGNGDDRLQAGSPAIDAGHNWAIVVLTGIDLDGNPRFAADENDFDPGCGIPVVVDMGAYEYQGDPFPVKLGDIDGDGIVGIADFLALLADWGACTQTCCLADLDLDGIVGITDFLILLGSWG